MILDAVEDLKKAPESSPSPSIRTFFSFPLEKEKEEKKGLIIFLNVNGPILSCIERFFVLYTTLRKDQPPMYRTIFLPREGGPPYDAMDGCPKCKG